MTIDAGLVSNASVDKGLVYALIAFNKIDIFTHHCHLYTFFWVHKARDHMLPMLKIGLFCPDIEMIDNNIIDIFPMEHQWYFIDSFSVGAVNNRRFMHITKERNLLFYLIGYRHFRSQQ